MCRKHAENNGAYKTSGKSRAPLRWGLDGKHHETHVGAPGPRHHRHYHGRHRYFFIITLDGTILLDTGFYNGVAKSQRSPHKSHRYFDCIQRHSCVFVYPLHGAANGAVGLEDTDLFAQGVGDTGALGTYRQHTDDSFVHDSGAA